MKDEFRFKCLILDDTPQSGVLQTQRHLESLGCEVSVLQRPSQIIEGIEALVEAHVLLCDLTFTNFAEAGEPAYILQSPQTDLKQFVSNWVLAVQRWCSNADKGDWSTNGIPGTQIEVQDIGFWLAAMVSQINPSCEIVFYTSAIKEITGPLSAIAQFRGSRFGVDTKNPDTAISKTAIEAALKRRQKRLLRSSPHVYQWFLRNVFLPVLIGRETIKGSAIQLNVNDPGKEFTLDAELFFLQFKEFTNEEKKMLLREFLINENWQLQPWELRAIHGLEHDLRQEKRECYPKATHIEQKDYLDRLLVAAVDAGTAGQGVLALLELARSELQKKEGKWHSASLQSAHKLCLGVVRNSEQDLEDLCKDFQSDRVSHDGTSHFFFVDEICEVEPWSPDEHSDEDSNPRIPFPIPYLRRVISALKHNLENPVNAGVTQQNPQFSLKSRIEENSLIVSWEDNSSGFTSVKDFRDAVMRSIEKHDAQYRGFPMAILFGVEFAAECVEVLIRGENECVGLQWHQIYPSTDVVSYTRSENTISSTFGFRWRFKHPR